ncbi:MAG: PEP-CTERM sorting domain-containing protein, partial [Phycisphaerae bacterium]
TIPAAKTLSVTGTAALATQVTLDGGTFSVADLANAALLQFDRGTFELTEANLIVGPGGLLGRTVTLSGEQAIHVTNTATVTAAGQLNLSGGEIRAGELVNYGQIELSGAGSLVDGNTLVNHGFLRGNGTISAPLSNMGDGQVSVAPGQRLVLAGGSNVNNGSMVNDGGVMEVSQALTNTPGGNISGHGAARFGFNGGLNNAGVFGLSFADAQVYGDITNEPNGIVSVAGASTAVFAGDLTNHGTVFLGADSRAVFQGNVGGGGSFPGGGTVEFVDGFSPGGSAGVARFGGGVAFAPTAALIIELAEADNSDPLAPRYDALDVVGDIHLSGTLDLSWLPVPGDPDSKFGGVYSILTYGGTRTGMFDSIDCQMPTYLDTSVFPDGVEYDDANGEVKIHLYDLLAGDADLDGRVAREDLHALQLGFGSGDPDWLTGDFNFDGRADFLDYLTWKANVGDSVPGAIPEPATLALLALGALGVMRRKRQ